MKIKIIIVSFFFNFSIVLAKPIEISFWHSMAGILGKTLGEITDDYNKSQTNYKIVPMYKGTYPEALTGIVASFRSGIKPDIAQIYDVATAMLIKPEGIIIPLHELLSKTNKSLDKNQLVQPMLDYYSDVNGNVMALPFNISTATIFYNKKAFKKAGLNPEIPPRTWQEMETFSKELLSSGMECGFTTTWPSWTVLESFTMINNVEFASNHNGFGGGNSQLILNDHKIIQYLERMFLWQKQKIFRYGGRVDDAQSLFTSQKCAMLLQSSGAYADLKESVNFDFGMSPLPCMQKEQKVIGNLIGGAAIWTFAGVAKEKYQGIADFLLYLVSPSVQARWQAKTGYVSVVKTEFLPNKYHGANDAVLSSIQKHIINSVGRFKGIRLGNYTLIRNIIDQQLESIWSWYNTPQMALENIVYEGNILLKRFNRNIK